MKRFCAPGVGAIAILLIAIRTPIAEALQQAGDFVIRKTQPQFEVEFDLSAARKVTYQNQLVPIWEPLGSSAIVQPGTVIRYQLKGVNRNQFAVKGLILSLPIQEETVYVLNSASVADGNGRINYSINGGKKFVEKPSIQVMLPDGKVEPRPAPIEGYTHVQWQFDDAVAPGSLLLASYQVRVR